ncbi:hypothetical protein MRB53_022995 [Persea americana]|uniref:Uncharacterized protein n=1 Tax=Persea americana TaxID=3435 RepID=A0ACC2L981_PERAE|nr:hypothetical protein MRB53_022995 [Persea americana]
MMRTLPLGGRGKVILTSRENITASLEEENCSVHKIDPLPADLAWKLFCKRAFRCSSPPGTCPHMNDVATEIVKRCSGLPLAIVLMGGSFSQLQTLSGLTGDLFSLMELAHLTQLKKLSVSIIGQEEASSVFTAIKEIANLHSFKIECRSIFGNYRELKLETLLPLPQYLEKLTLGADIRELPRWFAHFKSLRVLVLVNSMLVSDPLCSLSVLPNLVSLTSFHSYTGGQMGCRQGGFPKLRHLHITSFIELEEWTPIEEGTIPCIRFIRIVDCGKLKMLPQGFEQLKTLESLELIEMSQEFIGKLAAEDFYKVQHISKVIALPRSHCERNLPDPENVQLKTLESSGGMFYLSLCSGASSSSSPF